MFLNSHTYPEAEDSLNKANKLAKEVSKFSSSDRHKSQENELKISLAFARYGNVFLYVQGCVVNGQARN